MANEKELNELKGMLEDALKRIEVLEGKLKDKDKKLYRYFIPEKDAENNLIDKDKREDYINVLEEEACRINGGYTLYYGKGGYYPDTPAGEPFDPTKIIREESIIFDTYGNSPITTERFNHCCEYLHQDSLALMSNDSYEFIDTDSKK